VVNAYRFSISDAKSVAPFLKMLSQKVPSSKMMVKS